MVKGEGYKVSFSLEVVTQGNHYCNCSLLVTRSHLATKLSMSHNPHSFDLNLDLDPVSDYQRLLINIRDMLWEARNQPQGFPREMPILVPEAVTPPPHRLFDLRLHNEVASVTLRIRLDNLYALGYGFYNRDGRFQWMEFYNERRVHLIQDDQASLIRWLPFGGSYPELEAASRSNEDRRGISLHNVQLGLGPLREAVESLFHSGRQGDSAHARRQIARAFVPMIVMTSECIRFYSIQGEVVRSFVRGLLTTLSEELEYRVRNWADLSEVVLRFLCIINPNNIRIPRPAGLDNANAVVQELGAVKNNTHRIRERDDRDDNNRQPRSVDDEGKCTLEGQPLLEILWVRVDEIKRWDPAHLFGTVTVTDRLGTEFIYERTSSATQNVSPGQIIQLKSPSRCMSATDCFYFDFDLNHYWTVALGDWDTVSNVVEVSRGRVSWNVYDTVSNVYDKPQLKNFKGEYGSVSLSYVVLTNAVQATIEITLIKGDDWLYDNVYGDISAKYNGSGGYEFDALLFNRESNNYVNLSEEEHIPLLRSAVPVQLDSSLVVEARLKDHDTFSPNDEIANGLTTFPARTQGNDEKFIEGKKGKIKVQVSWSTV